MATKTIISDDMQQRVEALAREQNREPEDVVEEALGRYLASQRLEKLGTKLEKRALAKGIREEDVPELVHELRRENAERVR
jgi:predicted transcriptional regulator